jgi:hypothetical protein
VRRHWDLIETGDYAAAYDRLAPELQKGRARWIAAQRRDHLFSAYVVVDAALTSASTATARVVRLETDSEHSGCHRWRGSYSLREIAGEWRIARAALTSRGC